MLILKGFYFRSFESGSIGPWFWLLRWRICSLSTETHPAANQVLERSQWVLVAPLSALACKQDWQSPQARDDELLSGCDKKYRAVYQTNDLKYWKVIKPNHKHNFWWCLHLNILRLLINPSPSMAHTGTPHGAASKPMLKQSCSTNKPHLWLLSHAFRLDHSIITSTESTAEFLQAYFSLQYRQDHVLTTDPLHISPLSSAENFLGARRSISVYAIPLSKLKMTPPEAMLVSFSSFSTKRSKLSK